MASGGLLIGGAVTVGIAAASQHHAPQPSQAAAGTIRAATPAQHQAKGPPIRQLTARRSPPVFISIPAIKVRSRLLHVGLNSDGTIQVPSLFARPSRAAWYKYSATPGQVGTAVIEGHVDTYRGPSVFFSLGALEPGNVIDVRLADGTVTVFRVTGVRQYLKSKFPTRTFYGRAPYPALHLVTCGGAFDYTTGHYLSSTVVYAALTAVRAPH